MSLDQQWYDDNRERFEAESTSHDWELKDRCRHKDITRISRSEVRCSCGAGWTGESAFIDKLEKELQTTN